MGIHHSQFMNLSFSINRRDSETYWAKRRKTFCLQLRWERSNDRQKEPRSHHPVFFQWNKRSVPSCSSDWGGILQMRLLNGFYCWLIIQKPGTSFISSGRFILQWVLQPVCELWDHQKRCNINHRDSSQLKIDQKVRGRRCSLTGIA